MPLQVVEPMKRLPPSEKDRVWAAKGCGQLCGWAHLSRGLSPGSQPAAAAPQALTLVATGEAECRSTGNCGTGPGVARPPHQEASRTLTPKLLHTGRAREEGSCDAGLGAFEGSPGFLATFPSLPASWNRLSGPSTPLQQALPCRVASEHSPHARLGPSPLHTGPGLRVPRIPSPPLSMAQLEPAGRNGGI